MERMMIDLGPKLMNVSKTHRYLLNQKRKLAGLIIIS